MPAIDLELMHMQANLEHQLGDARAGLAEARLELSIFDLDQAAQDLHWPEGPPASKATLTARVRRLERTIETLEQALTGADAMSAAK